MHLQFLHLWFSFFALNFMHWHLVHYHKHHHHQMSPPGCPRIDYASIPRRLNSSGWDHLDGFRTVPRTPKWAFWDLSFVRSTRSEISVCSSTAALPCLIMSTKSPRCVSSIFDNFASCDEHWRMRLHTPWYELSSTTGLITATVFGFQSEIPHWEATVRASCRRQTRPTIAQSFARFHSDARSTTLAVRRIKSEVQAGSPGLQVGSRSGSGVPVCLLCSSVAYARSHTSSIGWSVDHARPQN